MKIPADKKGLVNDSVVNDSVFELFAESDTEDSKTASRVIHSILKKLNELIYKEVETKA